MLKDMDTAEGTQLLDSQDGRPVQAYRSQSITAATLRTAQTRNAHKTSDGNLTKPVLRHCCTRGVGIRWF